MGRRAPLSDKAQPADWTTVFTRLVVAPRPEADLRRRLADRGCPTERIDELLEMGRRTGLVDDGFYARLFVQARETWGRRRLIDELVARGVARATALDALESEGVDDDTRALAQAKQWLERGMEPRRVEGRLLRRGFSFRLSREAAGRSSEESDEMVL